MTTTVDFKDDGTITFLITGETYTLRAPTLGEFKAAKRLLFDAQRRVTEQSGKSTAELLKDPLAVADDESIVDSSVTGMIEVLALIFKTVGDKSLPDDPDTWPTWLVMDGQLANKIFAHWRTVPLGPGA